jgi:hypothetical protein
MDDTVLWVVLLVVIFLIPVLASLLWAGFNSARGEAYIKMRMQGPFVPVHEDEPSTIAEQAETSALEQPTLVDAPTSTDGKTPPKP